MPQARRTTAVMDAIRQRIAARALLPDLSGLSPMAAPEWWAMIATYLDPADRRHLMAGLGRAGFEGLT